MAPFPSLPEKMSENQLEYFSKLQLCPVSKKIMAKFASSRDHISTFSYISGPMFEQQKLPSSPESSATSLLFFLARIKGFIQQQTRGLKFIFKYL